jgi:hypothetical protein
MEESENNSKRPRIQIISATFVMITGLFIMLSMANTITGRITGGSSVQVNISDISIALWGLLIMAVGVWIIKRKDFNKSIFDTKPTYSRKMIPKENR